MTSRPIRIGIQIQPQHADYPAIRDAVARAEELGVDMIFNWDHFFPLYGEPEGKHFECWTMLGAWAEQTSRAQIGALVTCNSYRNPQLLADMARTVDCISDGRLVLGIGSGWFEKDYDEYGYEFGTAGGRLDQLAKDLPVLKERLGKLNPQPVGQVPVMIGGGGEKKTLRIVAEHADIWHSFSDADTLRHKLEVLDRHCATVGRSRDDIEISVGVGGRGREGRAPETPEQEGTPLLELGATMFTMGVGGPDYDLTPLEPWLQWRAQRNAALGGGDAPTPEIRG